MTILTSDAAIRPALDEVRRLVSDHDLVGVARTVPAGDISGPEMLAAFGDQLGAFLFESATGDGEFARFTFAGVAGPERFAVRNGTLSRLDELDDVAAAACPDPLEALRHFTSGPRVVAPPALEVPFAGGAVGYLAYEAVAAYERIPRPDSDPLALPDAWFGLCLTCTILDRQERVIHLVTHVDSDDDVDEAYETAVTRLDEMADALRRAVVAPVAVGVMAPELDDSTANLSRERFMSAVRRCLEYIAAGDIFQVQISRRFSLAYTGSPLRLYTALRTINPSPYLFYLRTDDCVLAGTSPEMLVRVGEDGRVDYHPIAGTRRRGRDPDEDAAMERQLRESEKEQAEHLMLVDLGRNDVGRIAEIGSVRVNDYAAVLRYANVMHLETSIEGRLRAGLSAVDALRACFPAGTVTGAPKVRAMEIIAELEPEVRGVYGGAVGYLDFKGNLDTAIALRTAVVRDTTVHLQAAAGIVADSTPEEEALEIDNKLRALARAVAAVTSA